MLAKSNISNNLVVFAVGGTGGHLFPAQALAHELKKKGISPIFAGVHLATSPYFKREFDSLSLRGASLKKPLQAFWQNSRGCLQAFRFLKKSRPSLVIGFGSYHSFPILVAAYLLKVPFFLVAADSTLGRVNRLFSAKALKIFSPFDHPSAIKVALPTLLQRVAKEEALTYYGLKDGKTTLLIFGGSQGALKLNELLAQVLSENRLDPNAYQILHLTGKNKKQDVLATLYRAKGFDFILKEFEERMEMAYSAADIAISRAGAMTVQELRFFTLPSLFIPYPGADAHQAKNAHLSVEVGGGLMLEESSLTVESFMISLENLFNRRASFKQALEAKNKEETSLSLASLVLKWLQRDNAS